MNDTRFSLGEGNTPMISLPTLAQRWGLSELWGKAEFLNPTGSYKDRIAAASMQVAVSQRMNGWLGTSSGNGGAAMSAYGARAGLPGILCVLEDAPSEKLGSIAPYGTLILSMPTIGPETMDLLGQIALQRQLFLTITAHAHNPEGMKGANEIGRELGAQPDISHVYVPSGGGGLLASTAIGLGETASNARPVAAQPAGCAPIASYLNGEIDAPRQASWSTDISGLQLPVPPDGALAASLVRERDGWGVCVPDELAWSIQEELARDEGVFVEPASAVALAAVFLDAEAGRIGAKDSPAVLLTGHGLKDLSRFQTASFAPTPTRPDEVESRIENWLPSDALFTRNGENRETRS